MQIIKQCLAKVVQYFYHKRHLNTVILISFTVTATLVLSLISISYYNRFHTEFEVMEQAEINATLEKIETHFTQKLRGIMSTFDALYYAVLDDGAVSESEFQLLYSASKDEIQSISLFDASGKLLTTAPTLKANAKVDVTQQAWFEYSQYAFTNKQFSVPHIQNIFVNNSGVYDWVISLSQAIRYTVDGQEQTGVLVIDIKYAALSDYINRLDFHEDGYVYLTDEQGTVLYHPEMQLIQSGEVELDTLPNDHQYVASTRVPYTGWNIIGVVEKDAYDIDVIKNNFFLMFLFVLFVGVMLLVNLLLSSMITRPIITLERAVHNIANGNLEAEMSSIGFLEMWNLENSVRMMARKIQKLMADALERQEELRKQELNVLQAQINPHFLYNTLDIIVWMIERKELQSASKVVTALGRFFRISLSKGKNTITVQEELEHVRNYLDIQMFRYKNKFTYTITADPNIEQCKTVKLIVQPIVENAIYHAMEFMDGDGEIAVSVYEQDGNIVFAIADNGMVMEEETRARLESGAVVPSKKGSGIGVANVLQRIQKTYGETYGLRYESELDEGTTVYIYIPKVEEEPNG